MEDLVRAGKVKEIGRQTTPSIAVETANTNCARAIKLFNVENPEIVADSNNKAFCPPDRIAPVSQP
jgi:hypothetical protein